MPRRPSASQLADQVDDLVKVLKVARDMFPVLAEQARLELGELTGRLPTSESGEDLSGYAPPAYADPTGETVVNFRPRVDGSCDPTRDLERIAEWLGHLQGLLGSTRRLLNQAPSVTLAVVDGRRPTDGRSAEEHAQRKFVRALTDSCCLISVDHDDEDRFGPGQLRRGLCNAHRLKFRRWQEANSGSLFGLDESERLVRWQVDAFGDVSRDGRDRPAETAGPYKTNLRDVA